MKKAKQNGTGWISPIFSSKGQDLGILILRIFVGFMLLRHGIEKISDFGTLSTGFPDPIGLGSKLSLFLITATETIGSMLVIIGFLTRPAALAIAFGMGVAAFFFHQPFSIAGSELPLMYMGIAVSLIIAGAGKYSIDGLINRKSGRTE